MTTEATAFDTNNPKGHVHLDEGDGQWRNRFFDSEQRRQELQAIVDRLPKTADGVPYQIGMEVWLPGFLKYPGYVEYIMDDMVAVNDMMDWPANGCDTIREYTVRHAASLYSTRAAAEAALAEREREGGGDAS